MDGWISPEPPRTLLISLLVIVQIKFLSLVPPPCHGCIILTTTVLLPASAVLSSPCFELLCQHSSVCLPSLWGYGCSPHVIAQCVLTMLALVIYWWSFSFLNTNHVQFVHRNNSNETQDYVVKNSKCSGNRDLP
uniref:Uncharacterized protein n=1 Tax=Neogobius melanostomus TaxID=47308 RepID=A0A8C6UF05_9GOBI